MALPTTRSEFKERILQNLGHPVININVTDDQIDNAIDDALEVFGKYHYEGSERKFLEVQVTDTIKSQKYITMPSNVFSVIRVFNFLSESAASWLSPQFHLSVDAILEASSGSVTHYWIARDYIAQLEDTLNARPIIDFQKYDENKLYIHSWWNKIPTDSYIIVECQVFLEPDEHPEVWTDKQLRDLTTAYVKKQWGTNLSKFGGIQMPGGTVLNGIEIYQQAIADVEKAEADIMENYQETPFFFVG